MTATVWISKIPLDSRLIKPMSSNVQDPNQGLSNYWNADEANPPPRSQSSSVEVWVDADLEGDIGKLPDLFVAGAVWVVSKQLADVLCQFDLGEGNLKPIKALKKDRQTTFPGEYFHLNLRNEKRTVLPEESSGLRDFVRGVWSTRAAISDGDIACSSEALEGPEIWVDPRLYGSVFLSDRLVEALSGAKLVKVFTGASGLKSCRVITK